MYKLAIQRAFSAQHYLIGGDWGAENTPHAHLYRIEIRLAASRLDAHGYLMDLDHLEQIMNSCVDRYHDKLLNDLPEFHQANPSIERFARCFFKKFVEHLDRHQFQEIEVVIWENELAWASYQECF